jgi:hypothetical protein
MSIRCNADVSRTMLEGNLKGYGTVWYNPSGIANILSLPRVKKINRVTYDSANEGKFVVHKPDGTKQHFKKSESVLFYLDTNNNVKGTVMITTVDDNKSHFTDRECLAAEMARKIQKQIGQPSTKTYINIVNKNLLKNCPVTETDIGNAEVIFGPNIGSLKGKTVRQTVERYIGYTH